MDYKSKTKKKKEAEALQKMGERLVELPAEQIEDLDLPEGIYKAVTFAKTLKRGALRRQMQYIGTLMRRYDPAPIQEALQNVERGTTKSLRRSKK